MIYRPSTLFIFSEKILRMDSFWKLLYFLGSRRFMPSLCHSIRTDKDKVSWPCLPLSKIIVRSAPNDFGMFVEIVAIPKSFERLGLRDQDLGYSERWKRKRFLRNRLVKLDIAISLIAKKVVVTSWWSKRFDYRQDSFSQVPDESWRGDRGTNGCP